MLVAVIASLAGLVVVAVALWTQGPEELGVDDAWVPWQELPAPHQIVQREFPRRPFGYDPVAVDAHLVAIAGAWIDLAEAAGPEALAAARRRVAVRRGGDWFKGLPATQASDERTADLSDQPDPADQTVELARTDSQDETPDPKVPLADDADADTNSAADARGPDDS